MIDVHIFTKSRLIAIRTVNVLILSILVFMVIVGVIEFLLKKPFESKFEEIFLVLLGVSIVVIVIAKIKHVVMKKHFAIDPVKYKLILNSSYEIERIMHLNRLEPRYNYLIGVEDGSKIEITPLSALDLIKKSPYTIEVEYRSTYIVDWPFMKYVYIFY